MLITKRQRPNAEAPPGAETRGQPPSYGPGWIKRIPQVFKLALVPLGGEVIDYDRGILAEPIPGQVLPLQNSQFAQLERGPIRNFFVRDWYWRGMWRTPFSTTFDDAVAPNAHVPLAAPEGRWKRTPGGTQMTGRPRLTYVLRTPAWTIDPATQDAKSNA
jgi:hypothetical protein